MAQPAAVRSTSWSITLGALLIILGLVATMAPLFATLTLMRLMGWLLIIAAIEQAINAFLRRDEGGLFLKVVLAVLYGIVAIMLLRRPVSGAIVATAAIAILFLLDGVLVLAAAVGARREGARSGWLFVGGIMSLLFAAIVLYEFPVSALWTIGLLVGIRLIFKGMEHIMSALPAPRRDVDRPGLKRAA